MSAKSNKTTITIITIRDAINQKLLYHGTGTCVTGWAGGCTSWVGGCSSCDCSGGVVAGGNPSCDIAGGGVTACPWVGCEDCWVNGFCPGIVMVGFGNSWVMGGFDSIGGLIGIVTYGGGELDELWSSAKALLIGINVKLQKKAMKIISMNTEIIFFT